MADDDDEQQQTNKLNDEKMKIKGIPGGNWLETVWKMGW